MITISNMQTATSGAAVVATSADPVVWVDPNGALLAVNAHGIDFAPIATAYQVGVAVEGVVYSSANAILLRDNGGSIAIGDDGVVHGFTGIYQYWDATVETDIVNDGRIIGDIAVYVGGADDTIDNAGLIKSTSTYAIVTFDGNDVITNRGRIIGDIQLGLGDDKFIAKSGGSVDGTINGGPGNDKYWIVDNKLTLTDDSGTDKIYSKVSHTLGATFENLTLRGSKDLNGTGNASQNVIVGNDGDNRLKGYGNDDTLKGGKGADILLGGKGDDTLIGGRGKDTYTGGKGADTFVFGNNSGKDTIKDFNPNSGAEDVDLSGMASITGYSDLTNNHMTQVGSDTVIDGGGGDVLTLVGIDIGDLGANDFLF